MDSYIKLFEYHCDSLERALASLYNLRIALQDALISNSDPTKHEIAILKARILCKQVKERYDSALAKLNIQIGKERENAFTPLLKEFRNSLDNTAQVTETCYQHLLNEISLSQNMVFSMLAFIAERPLLDVEIYQDYYRPNVSKN